MSDASLPLTIAEYSEWGDPVRDEPSGISSLLDSYCPFRCLVRQLQQATLNPTGTSPLSCAAPSVYLTGAVRDPRVPAWHPVGYMALLRRLHLARSGESGGGGARGGGAASTGRVHSEGPGVGPPWEVESQAEQLLARLRHELKTKNPQLRGKAEATVFAPHTGVEYSAYAGTGTGGGERHSAARAMVERVLKFSQSCETGCTGEGVGGASFQLLDVEVGRGGHFGSSNRSSQMQQTAREAAFLHIALGIPLR
jgi:hypothetical protein